MVVDVAISWNTHRMRRAFRFCVVFLSSTLLSCGRIGFDLAADTAELSSGATSSDTAFSENGSDTSVTSDGFSDTGTSSDLGTAQTTDPLFDSVNDTIYNSIEDTTSDFYTANNVDTQTAANVDSQTLDTSTGSVIAGDTNARTDSGSGATADTAALTDSDAATDSDTPVDSDMVTDTGTIIDTGTATDTGVLYDANTIIATRVPIPVRENSVYYDRTENLLGLQGVWYSYTDDVSTITLANAVDDTLCVSGTVNGGPDWSYFYTGLGFYICQGYNPTTTYSIQTCPWSPYLMDRVIGISFEVSGTFPGSGTLALMFMSASGRWTIPAAGRHDVLFTDVSPYDTDSVFTPESTTLIQFQLGNTQNSVIPFDFCIGNVEILLSPAS